MTSTRHEGPMIGEPTTMAGSGPSSESAPAATLTASAELIALATNADQSRGNEHGKCCESFHRAISFFSAMDCDRPSNLIGLRS